MVSYGLSKRTKSGPADADHCNPLVCSAPQRSTRSVQPNPSLSLGWRQNPPREPLESIEESPQCHRERDPSQRSDFLADDGHWAFLRCLRRFRQWIMDHLSRLVLPIRSGNELETDQIDRVSCRC